MANPVLDFHEAHAPRAALLDLNNRNATETSPLTRERFDWMIETASVATFVAPAAGFLIAFAHVDKFDGGHFRWFGQRYRQFLYIDRVVVAEDARGYGFGRLLYEELFACAPALGADCVVCEVNVVPPNPVSERFHAKLGFEEVGRATFDNGAKTVRYLLRQLD